MKTTACNIGLHFRKLAFFSHRFGLPVKCKNNLLALIFMMDLTAGLCLRKESIEHHLR